MRPIEKIPGWGNTVEIFSRKIKDLIRQVSGNLNGRVFVSVFLLFAVRFFIVHLQMYRIMKPAQSTPKSFFTPLLLVTLLLFIMCVVIGLSSCASNQNSEELPQTDTVMEQETPGAIPPPIDSMGMDSVNGQPTRY